MKIIKFGGKSLVSGRPITAALNIIESSFLKHEAPTVVVSARGNTTDRLESLIDLAVHGAPFEDDLVRLCAEQKVDVDVDLSYEEGLLRRLLTGISMLNECSPKIADQVRSLGETFSSKVMAALLSAKGLPAIPVDAGELIVTDTNYGEANVILDLSSTKTNAYFAQLPDGVIPVVTGYIARDIEGNRTTLGRNGSNYTATLLANFLNAFQVDNYTHVDGIFTAHPDWVLEARKINELSYTEAAELSQFGADILHYKTIDPLQEKGIPLRILNTLNPDGDRQSGTLISAHIKQSSVKALAALKGKALIHFEGREMLGQVGIDARIFAAFRDFGVSASLVSQGSTERGIAIVVDEKDADRAVQALYEEFSHDLSKGLTTAVYAEKGLAVVALVGVSLSHFDRPFVALVRNGIVPKLLNNTIPGDTLCLLVREKEVRKALNVIHGEMFEHQKKIHVAVIGHGSVGGAFIDQVIRQREDIRKRKDIDLCLFAVANSRTILLDKNGIDADWRRRKEACTASVSIVHEIIRYAKEEHLENVVVVDNTASESVATSYPLLVENGFDIVSSNKVANTRPYREYTRLRQTLAKYRKSYRYETNVGAGLPLIDNLRLLHLSGERITSIRGLFSGSLSFIFNQLGNGRGFLETLKQAEKEHYTEPDPRIDLCGKDVARKLLILARELDIPCEMDDVFVQNLVPESLRELPFELFKTHLKELDRHFESLCVVPEDMVMRYVGELLIGDDGTLVSLSCGLKAVPKDSALGRVKGADSCFEIFTESYGTLPIIIQGAGAGADVTARGVFGDLLRTAEHYDPFGTQVHSS